MRIRCPSHRPAGSAALSSTSKELLRRSPRLSRLLHPHSVALTYSTGTASSSPTPRTKPRPTRRHQRGCTLIASHLLLKPTSRRRRCSIPHPHGAATLKPAPRATSPRRLSPSATILAPNRTKLISLLSLFPAWWIPRFLSSYEVVSVMLLFCYRVYLHWWPILTASVCNMLLCSLYLHWWRTLMPSGCNMCNSGNRLALIACLFISLLSCLVVCL